MHQAEMDSLIDPSKPVCRVLIMRKRGFDVLARLTANAVAPGESEVDLGIGEVARILVHASPLERALEVRDRLLDLFGRLCFLSPLALLFERVSLALSGQLEQAVPEVCFSHRPTARVVLSRDEFERAALQTDRALLVCDGIIDQARGVSRSEVLESKRSDGVVTKLRALVINRKRT